MHERSRMSIAMSRILVSKATAKGFEDEIIELSSEKQKLINRMNEINERVDLLEIEVERYVRDFNYKRRKNL